MTKQSFGNATFLAIAINYCKNIFEASTVTTTLSLLWEKCLNILQEEVDDERKYNVWLRPLQAHEYQDKKGKTFVLFLLAPNRFVLEEVKKQFKQRIEEILREILPDIPSRLEIGMGTAPTHQANPEQKSTDLKPQGNFSNPKSQLQFGDMEHKKNNINVRFTFDSFVEGKSNQLARAAAVQVAHHLGHAYNPLFIYGGVGLGKTHLMHAIGNYVLNHDENATILYLHSERFVADMIKALQRNAMNDFKRFYRSLDVLLIDDIQFFAGKDRSQEEFFHTFNALLDGQQQIVLTCDRYPKEINGLEERLKSRFGWGLTVSVEPPELETRVAILMTKADQLNVTLPSDVAFFIAKNIQSNVRELEGALKRVIANAHFTGNPITVDFTREALKDLLTLQAKLITIENIQKTVADYYKLKLADLLSKRRSRSIARPRQMAMALAKELTNHSLPEIGDAFGGRDHTTVLHACRKIKELLTSSHDLLEDYKHFIRILSG